MRILVAALAIVMALGVCSTAFAAASWSTFNINKTSSYNIYDTFAIQNVASDFDYTAYQTIGNVDGVYGTKTKNGVIYVQKYKGVSPGVLTADGITGSKTWTKLYNSLTGVTYKGMKYYAGYSYDPHDVAWVARINSSTNRWQTVNQKGDWVNFGK